MRPAVSPGMASGESELVVLHTKLTTYLPWSQPFLHDFFVALGRHTRNVVVCNRTEHLASFPLPHIVRVPMPCLVHPSYGLNAASYVQRRWRPAVIHAHFGFSGLHSLIFKRLLNIPLVVTFGGRDATAQMALPRFRPLYAVLLQSADRLVAVSAELRDQLVSAGAPPEKVEVIRRGTDLKKFSTIGRGIGLEGATVTLLMVGRIVEKKGHRYALDAVARLVADRVPVRLVIVGDGALAPVVRRYARSLSLSGVVEFAGALSQEEVRAHMQRADILVHCSVTGQDGDREGVPNAVVEAAAIGLPVVATRHGGLLEVVKDHVTGLLVDERDVDGLAAAIRELVLSAERRRALGTAAARHVHAEFDAERQVRRHVDLYRELVSMTPPAAAPLPVDFASRLIAAMADRRHANEYSMLDLAGWLRGRRQFRITSPDDEQPLFESATERLQRSGTRLHPRLKALARGALAGLIGVRGKVGRGWIPRRVEAADRAALAFVDRGGDISRVDESWDFDAIEHFLREQVSSVTGP